MAAQERIRKELRPLLRLIGAPDDLIGLFRIVEEFERILALFLPIAGQESIQKLQRVEAVIASIEAKRPIILQTFPRTNLGKRKTLTDYYGTHPHYTIYETLPEETIFSGQLRALIASLLPVCIRLEHVRINIPYPYADRAVRLSRYLRQLSKPNTDERKLLLELPLHALTPDKMCEAISHCCSRLGLELKSSGPLQSFQHIQRSLMWFQEGGWPTSHGNIFSRQSHGKPGERRQVSLETKDSDRRVEIEICLEVDRPIRMARYLPRPDEVTAREEKFDPNQSDDVAPVAATIELDAEKRCVYQLENRRRSAAQNARFKAQAIELANQNLPIDRRTLSGYELQCFLHALGDLNLPVWDVIPVRSRSYVAAWAACRFFLSRDEADVRKIRAGEITDAEGRYDYPLWSSRTNQFLLPAVPPRHAPPKPNSNTVKTTNRFLLSVPELLVRILKRLPNQPGLLFETNIEKSFEKLLAQINQHNNFKPEISPSRLQGVVAEQMSRMAPADHVVSIYFRGQPPNQHNPAVYSVIPVSRLQLLYEEACTRVGRRAGVSLSQVTQSGFPDFTEASDLNVGSLHVPQASAVSATVKHIVKELRALSASPGAPLARLHNTYTAYVTLFLLATSGIRAVSSPLPAIFDLDPHTGICFVSDKDNPRYGNAHLAWLHPVLVEQIGLYRQHVTRLRQSLALINPSSLDRLDASVEAKQLSSHLSPKRDLDQEQLAISSPLLFFLSHQGADLLDVSPSLLASYLGPEWSLRVGALRHFVRSHLLQYNRSGELINALLGHGERGESAWGKFSTLPPLIWRKQIEEAINPCLKKLGFAAIPSPLLASLR
ncbi:MAG: hypothetical protein IPL58_16300 [Betaproteobacteria bacterium]|uniref:Uncharacterized protein n=1 Tax=Candidatus Proximibacter danicus TaxID=2954365 RepID=A0A9D7PRD4_9PROT|nr:hypothetical protein [Candidatus Proximibacter danicus]